MFEHGKVEKIMLENFQVGNVMANCLVENLLGSNVCVEIVEFENSMIENDKFDI